MRTFVKKLMSTLYPLYHHHLGLDGTPWELYLEAGKNERHGKGSMIDS